MTASGTPPTDDGLEQEGIWDDASAAEPSATDDAAETPATGVPGLTRRLTSTEPEPGPAGLLYADVPNRIMALIIDVIVLSVVGAALASVLGGVVTEAGAIDSAGGELDVAAFIILLVLQLALSFVYFVSLWTLAGATVGMRLLSLRVGDAGDGRHVSWRAAAVRWLFLGVPSLLASLAVYVPNPIGLILGALGLTWMLALLYTMAQSPAKQGLHDRFAHTIVIKARRRSI
jgi:uncharacterized RDD family membrane protein YckC